MIFISLASSQSIVVPLEIEVEDLREIDHRLQELDLLREKSKEQEKTIAELENALAIEKRTNELNERELYLNKKIIEVKDMEIQALNRNFDQMKDVADRAIKLAETSKPKSNWQLYGILGMAAFLLGLSVGGL